MIARFAQMGITIVAKIANEKIMLVMMALSYVQNAPNGSQRIPFDGTWIHDMWGAFNDPHIVLVAVNNGFWIIEDAQKLSSVP